MNRMSYSSSGILSFSFCLFRICLLHWPSDSQKTQQLGIQMRFKNLHSYTFQLALTQQLILTKISNTAVTYPVEALCFPCLSASRSFVTELFRGESLGKLRDNRTMRVLCKSLVSFGVERECILEAIQYVSVLISAGSRLEFSISQELPSWTTIKQRR